MNVSKIGQKKEKSVIGRKEVAPRIVQLGGSLPAKPHEYYSRLWTPALSEKAEFEQKSVNGLPVVKCPKFKNLFEYSQKYNEALNFKRKLWLTPGVGNNILPVKKTSPRPLPDEAIGLYQPDFHKWYNRLVHENTIVLPPIDTSNRMKETVHDSRSLREKKYIAEARRQTGPRERFARDELYVPDVYNQCFTCGECHRQYVNDIYSKTWSLRNSQNTTCSSTTDDRTNMTRQTCDVLGERYCKACIESRNKNFSLRIEDRLLNNNDLRKVHYKSVMF